LILLLDFDCFKFQPIRTQLKFKKFWKIINY
jgi:hypothetical protein